MILSDFILPDVMAARSVNLERDMGDEVTLRHYHLTGKGLEILGRLAAALNGERVYAWSLVGPYGMGKSSFANFLLAFCGSEAEEETRLARRMLDEKDSDLARDIVELLDKHFAKKKGLFRVAVTSSFESINRSLAKGLRRALSEIRHRSKVPSRELTELIARADELCSHTTPETAALVELFKAAGRLHGAPVALVIDEFGKNLEYMARFPAQGDLFVLQALAETDNIFIWVCLHQAFEEYASRLSARQLQEWGKIHGRFEDISFIEPRSEMIRFICETLARKSNDRTLSKAVQGWAEYFHNQATRLDLPELRELDVETIERLYPLHPIAAVALPELCTRFAQNDRTLFAFLCSGDPKALPAFLTTETIDTKAGQLASFGLERLYDYFLSSSSTALMNRPESQRWIEIHDIIERSRNIDPFHLDVLRVIGLLNLISGPSRFRASANLVSFAFMRPQSSSRVAGKNLQDAIESNVEKGVLIYREYADEYRLWEGTDFDIPAAIRERKALLATQALDNVLKDTLPLTPLTASKHSYIYGTLRHFERRWCGFSELAAEAVNCSSDEFDGLIVYCFGKEQEIPAPPSKTEDGRPIILCYAACEEQIRDRVLEAAAAKAVLEESPELEHDGIARKEARFRAHNAEERLREYLSALFIPGNQEAIWYARAERLHLVSHKDLSRLLSDCCDDVYSSCPTIRNELINRNSLSSAAARARRELMQAMIDNEALENLGFKGTGPEVAIYRTMLLAESVHCHVGEGVWQLVAPESGSSYFPLWQALNKAIDSAGDALVPVVDLIRLLRSAPFGLKVGPIPVFLCLYLIVNSDEIALYQEGAFVPSLGPKEMELMTKRPEFFTLRRFSEGKLRGQVFQLYMSLLKAQSNSDTRQMRNATLISVVGPLIRFVKNLNPYVLNTRSLSRYAANVRRVLQQARDPVDLLFVDLPEAVGLSGFDDSEPASSEDLAAFRERFTKAIIELRQCYPRLIERIKQVVLEAFGHDEDVSGLRVQLKERAPRLLERCSDRDFRPFLATLAGFSDSDQEWLVSLATIAVQRPVDSWREADLNAFPVRMHDFAGRFRALETLIGRTERLPAADSRGEPRMVTLVRPDGRTSSNIIWVDETCVPKAQDALDRLIRESGADISALQTIFALLGEHLTSGEPKTGEEQGCEQKK